jgi:predicted homoserine dehydrogenase-like protein
MIIVDSKLEQRQKDGKPIRAGFIGAGMMSKAILNLIENNISGMKVAAISNRTLSKAKDIYEFSGVSNIKSVDSVKALDRAIESGGYAITEDYSLLCESAALDVLVDITGHVEFGVEVLLTAFKHGKDVITFNAEVDSTLGPILSIYADRAGVVYSGSDGDQPGVTMNLYRFVQGLGLTPMLAGNIKGLQDPYRNPTTQEEFAKYWGMGPEKATSFADGTKMNMEQACVANCTGLKVAKRGMLGYAFDGHVDDMTGMYDYEHIKELGGIIDFALGAKPGPAVFVYGSIEDELSRHHLAYYKLGKGPLYSFYTPYHLCIFEVPTSIARVVDFGDHVLKPLGSPVVEVISIAKTDLKSGSMLDGPGFYTLYGECENNDVVLKERLLPIGLTETGVKLKRDIKKDQPLTFDDVEFDESRMIFKLYREQMSLINQ